VRRYGHLDKPKLTPEDVKRRVMSVFRSFEKINEDEVNKSACVIVSLHLIFTYLK